MLRTTSRYLQPTLLHYGTFHRQTRFIYSTCCRLAAGGSRSDHHRVPIYSTCCRLAAGLSIEPSLSSTDLLFPFCFPLRAWAGLVPCGLRELWAVPVPCDDCDHRPKFSLYAFRMLVLMLRSVCVGLHFSVFFSLWVHVLFVLYSFFN